MQLLENISKYSQRREVLSHYSVEAYRLRWESALALSRIAQTALVMVKQERTHVAFKMPYACTWSICCSNKSSSCAELSSQAI